jgi:hypothetical protein
MCKDCNWKAARTADKLIQVKMAMRELNETVRKLKMAGAEEVDGLEDVGVGRVKGNQLAEDTSEVLHGNDNV